MFVLNVTWPSLPSRVAVVSKSFEGQTDKKEEWYGTEYKQEAIAEEVLQVSGSWLESNLSTRTEGVDHTSPDAPPVWPASIHYAL